MPGSIEWDIRKFSNKLVPMKAVIFSILLILSQISFSQEPADSILLLNGKVLNGKILGLEWSNGDSILKYESISKKGTNRVDIVSTYRVFSFTQGGETNVLYRQDEIQGNYLSERETKEVTFGSYDARQTFKPHVAFWSGFALGFGASLIDTYLTKKEANDSSLIAPKIPGFYKANPTIFPFFVPAVLSVSWSFPTFKLREKNIIHKQYHHNDNFYRGYHRIAKQKRMLGALFGSIGGIAANMIIYYAVQ